ncbi:hypothetical protein Scep_010678 [Stephania cephalantha]|uniref:Uncharacterized protein n=1 Tax=Stephania cephalantha TaxID=152367 RepID=A0AAP0JVL4_9MAGN
MVAMPSLQIQFSHTSYSCCGYKALSRPHLFNAQCSRSVIETYRHRLHICICMAFLMPSPGLTSFSESISNMISLTIFVITVLINVCIQMRTGVKQITS